LFAFSSFVSSAQEELHFVLQAMTVRGANLAVKKVSVERLAIAPMIFIVTVMANNVAMASARCGALILVLVPPLGLVGIKVKL